MIDDGCQALSSRNQGGQAIEGCPVHREAWLPDFLRNCNSSRAMKDWGLSPAGKSSCEKAECLPSHCCSRIPSSAHRPQAACSTVPRLLQAILARTSIPRMWLSCCLLVSEDMASSCKDPRDSHPSEGGSIPDPSKSWMPSSMTVFPQRNVSLCGSRRPLLHLGYPPPRDRGQYAPEGGPRLPHTISVSLHYRWRKRLRDGVIFQRSQENNSEVRLRNRAVHM